MAAIAATSTTGASSTALARATVRKKPKLPAAWRPGWRTCSVIAVTRTSSIPTSSTADKHLGDGEFRVPHRNDVERRDEGDCQP